MKHLILTLILCLVDRSEQKRVILVSTWDMATTYQVVPPKPFNFSRPNEWTKWIRRFEHFRSASGLDEKSEAAQVNTLIYTMGAEADDIFQSFGLSDEDKKKYETVKSKFDSHFVKRRNVIYERAMFNKHKQEEGEAVDEFIIALYSLSEYCEYDHPLYSLSEYCEYGAFREEMIRDRIVVGIRDAAISLKLQLKETLTLAKALNDVREAETIKSQQPQTREQKDVKSDTTATVSAVHTKRPGTKKGTRTQPNASARTVCFRCGRSPQHDRLHSVHLRPGSDSLARTLLMATYRLWLWSISACIVTSCHM